MHKYFPTNMWHMFVAWQKATALPEFTGFIVPSSVNLEPNAQAAMEHTTGKKCLLVGLQYPVSLWDTPIDEITPVPQPLSAEASKPGIQRLIHFLEQIRKEHGDHQLYYISLGSDTFPTTRPELITFLLESFREQRVPFVFADAAPQSSLSDAYIEEINRSGIGHIYKGFAPQ